MILKRTLVSLLVVSLAFVAIHSANAQSCPTRKGLFGGRIKQAIANRRCQRQLSKCKTAVTESPSCRYLPICPVAKEPSDSACPTVKMLEIPGMGGSSLCWWLMQDCDSGNVSTIASSYCDSGCECDFISGTCACPESAETGFDPSEPLVIPGPVISTERRHDFRTNRAIMDTVFKFTYTDKKLNYRPNRGTILKYGADQGRHYALFEIGRCRVAVVIEQVPDSEPVQKAELRTFPGHPAEGVVISGSEVYHVAGLTRD